MATQRESDAILMQNMVREAARWLQNQVPGLGNQHQSTQGDGDTHLGYEDENGQWHSYWRAGDGVGTKPVGP